MLSPALLRLTIPHLLANQHLLEKRTPLKFAVDNTFYPQYCTGATQAEITEALKAINSLNYGIILHYAREAPIGDPALQMDTWMNGTLNTINLTPPGDFAAIKFSGSGVVDAKSPQLLSALDAICSAAKARGVGVLVDAEHFNMQQDIDAITLGLMRKYNTSSAVVWNTYQLYLQRTPGVLAEHMAAAKREGWVLGAKLVRGAYIGSDPRDAIWPTKADTDMAYDNNVAKLIAWTEGRAEVMVASHNRESIMKAREVAGARKVVYAQLLGMADELSLELVELGERVVKYACWGSTRECVEYLLRRVEENSDVAGRGKDEFRALWGEVKRRIGISAAA